MRHQDSCGTPLGPHPLTIAGEPATGAASRVGAVMLVYGGVTMLLKAVPP
jgi:hypothetical protein